ncbi:MAG: type II toxin-antitoxin system VapC family toxin [Phycisphaerae bacterium]|nr:type II toxin-antitoxin system VapC family toxin [Phycisphaerae bacterium]
MGKDKTTKPTLYLETTIVSYLTARPSRDIVILGHQETTRQWWETKRSEYRIFISPFVIEESSAGDPAASRKRIQILEEMDVLPVNSSLEKLSQELQKYLEIPDKARLDAIHLAFSILYELDYLLTWNCSHLANANALRKLARMAKERNYWLPIVCTPDEMISDEKEK